MLTSTGAGAVLSYKNTTVGSEVQRHVETVQEVTFGKEGGHVSNSIAFRFSFCSIRSEPD